MVGLIDSFYIPESRLRSHLAKGNPYEVLIVCNNVELFIDGKEVFD